MVKGMTTFLVSMDLVVPVVIKQGCGIVIGLVTGKEITYFESESE